MVNRAVEGSGTILTVTVPDDEIRPHPHRLAASRCRRCQKTVPVG